MISPERESELERAVDAAVTAADRLIMDAAEGDKDILDYLTASVTIRFLEKLGMSLRAAGLMKIDPALAARRLRDET